MIAHPPDRWLYLFFPVVIKLSRHNKITANSPPEPKTDTIQQHNPPDRRLYLFIFRVVIARTAHPTDRRLYLFFCPVVIDRAPARQTTVSFFSGRNENFQPQQKNCQFPARTKNWYNIQHNPPDRWLYLFFPVVIARTAHPTDRWLYLFFSGRNIISFLRLWVR